MYYLTRSSDARLIFLDRSVHQDHKVQLQVVDTTGKRLPAGY